MYVASRNPNIVVPGDPRERPGIATGFSQAGQEGVPQRIEHKSADRLLIVLLGLGCQSLENLPVLPLETRRFHVATASLGSPHPAFQRLPNTLPVGFYDVPNSRSHRENPTGSSRLTVCNKKCPVSPVRPGDCFPAKPETFFGTKSRVTQNCRDRCERLGGCG